MDTRTPVRQIKKVWKHIPTMRATVPATVPGTKGTRHTKQPVPSVPGTLNQMSQKRRNLLTNLVAVCLVMLPIAAALGEEQLLQLVRPPEPILLGEVQGDPFELVSVRIEGDALVCQVSYVGGCAAHQFASSWWSGFRESDPVQAGVGLVHDAGGDACRDTITETLRFDLMPMKKAYEGGYRAKHGRIAVGVRGFQTPIPKRPISGKISDMSVSHRLGDRSPEPLNNVHGLLYEF